MSLKVVKAELQKKASPRRAQVLQRYFKTGPGEYGEGDVFLGLRVPQLREIAKRYFVNLSLGDIKKLLESKIHEHRSIAVMMLRLKTEKSIESERDILVHFLIKHRRWLNNWDLIDGNVDRILGPYLDGKKKDLLYRYARSKIIWERRIAIISTFHFIRLGKFGETLKIAKILLNDEHDLIHKATGWMLREVGNRERSVLESFLKRHCRKMPRTMLRYAIERFPERRRRAYMLGNV